MASYFAGTDRTYWPTALLCANDILAVGALQAIRAAGLAVPDDLALVGFDDMDLCSYTDPQLSTVHLPAYDVGSYAAEALLGWLEKKAFHGREVVFPARFVRRGSA